MAAAPDSFVLDLAKVLSTAAAGGYLANRLKQPVLLGYILCGVAIGPLGFKLLTDPEQIRALAQLGVAFLLFALGVEFSLAELKRIKDVALQGSLLQIGGTMAVVAAVTFALGWTETWTEGIFVGAVLSLSSTAVVLKTLTERGETGTIHGQIALAILIAQDLALGLMLAVLPALQQPDRILSALQLAALKAALVFAAALVLGRWVVPRLLDAIAATESKELLLLTTIALCLGVALGTASLGLSVEMGAFIAGLMVSNSDRADQALTRLLPLRDTFASLFFASIGMLIDPLVLWQNVGTVLGLVLLVMVSKALIVFPIVLRFGYSFKTALTTAATINQIGEFSFVLLLQGAALGLVSDRAYLLLLGTTAITLVLSPLAMASAPHLAERLERFSPLRPWIAKLESPKEISVPDRLSHHVVVAGYGRVGRTIVKILQRQGYPVLVLENSEAAVRQLRRDGVPFIYGDAHAELVLEKTHLDRAVALAIALPDPSSTKLLLEHALQIAPGLDAIARVHDRRELDTLLRMGAKEVVQPEFEAALELSAHLLHQLGEQEAQIRQTIDQVRLSRYFKVRSDPD
ncbi:MAG: cation:proton antiporter [Cyanophyceae cyanobacterium]